MPGFSILNVLLISHLNRYLPHLKAMFPRKVDWVSWASESVQTFQEAQGKKHIYLPSDLKGQLKCQVASHQAATVPAHVGTLSAGAHQKPGWQTYSSMIN